MRWSVLAPVLVLASACADERDPQADVTGIPTGADASATGDTTAVTSAADVETGDKLDVPGDGSGTGAGEGGMLCEQDVDIVFVMDVSTSMGPFLSTLADEILVVDQALQQLMLPGQPHYGLVVFVDDFALLGAGAPYPDVQTLRQDFMTWSAFTSSNQQVAGGNFNTTWPENSLDALWVAATGFQWRSEDTTLRLVIHTTDDTFWDGPTNGNGVAIQHGYAEVVTALQERQIRQFTFAAQIGGECECLDVTPGWSTPYMGQDTIPDATDGGWFDLDLVLAGQQSLSAAINGAVEDKMCEPYPPIG
jgi:hypothetical protein